MEEPTPLAQILIFNATFQSWIAALYTRKWLQAEHTQFFYATTGGSQRWATIAITSVKFHWKMVSHVSEFRRATSTLCCIQATAE
jgi:hypothetical protein